MPSWVPPYNGGKVRMPLGLYNWDVPDRFGQISDTYFHDTGFKSVGFWLVYTGSSRGTLNCYAGDRLKAMAKNPLLAPASGCIPFVGFSFAGNDYKTADMANGSMDRFLRQFVIDAKNTGFTKAWFRPNYEANQATCPGGWDHSPTWAANFRACFEHVYTVLHDQGAKQGVEVRVFFDTTTQIWSGNAPLVGAYAPRMGFCDGLSVDVFGGNPWFNTEVDWHGYAKQPAFSKFAGPIVPTIARSKDEWSADNTPGAGPGKIGYTFDNLAHQLCYVGANQYSAEGGGGENMIDLIKAICISHQVPLIHAEWGYGANSPAWGGGGGFGTSYNCALVPNPKGKAYWVANDRNFWPYMLLNWVPAIEAIGVAHLGGAVYDGADGNGESGSAASRGGFADGGMLGTLGKAFLGVAPPPSPKAVP